MINKTEIIKDLERLNQTYKIKINGINEERLIFNNSDEVFKIYGEMDEGVLIPFNEPTYEVLNEFLYDFIDYLKIQDEDLTEETINNNFLDSLNIEPLIYNNDLLNWVSANLTNAYYCDEIINEGLSKDVTFFNLLQMANARFKEELYNNALNLTIDYLKEKGLINDEEDLKEEYKQRQIETPFNKY